MGGVGGAGIVVPLSMIFFRFDAKNAVALSNFSIFLSALIRYLIFMSDKHPLKNGTGLMLDYNVSIICLPLIIAGVSVGVIVNIMMPNVIVGSFYVLMIGYFSFGVMKKACNLHFAESKAFKEKQQEGKAKKDEESKS